MDKMPKTQTPVKAPDLKPNILIVDDVPESLVLLSQLLMEQGYEPRPVPGGKLALAAAKADPPDLILLDINMPEMDGFEICKQLKADEALKHIPVLFLTGFTKKADKVKAFSMGGVDYITKPFQLEEVCARIKTHLHLHRLQMELEKHSNRLEGLVHDKIIELEMQNEELRTSQSELEAARMSYYDLYNLAPMGYCTITGKELILKVNLATAALLGETKDALINQKISRFIFREHQDIYYFHCKKIFETHQPQTFELQMVKKDGTAFWVQMDISVTDIAGTAINCNMVLSEITTRKRAEEKLCETNAYLENLINYANVPIVVWDPQFRITRFNHAFELLTGHREADVIGNSLVMLFPPELIENSMALIRETLTGERWKTVEIKILHLDESVRTVLWNSATLFAADGQTPIATIAQGHDITARIESENALKESEGRFVQLAEQSRTIAWEVDFLGMYTYVSEVSLAVLGYRPDELVGRMHFYDFHPESGRKEFKEAAFAVFAQKKPFHDLENAAQTKDGQSVWLSTNGFPLLDAAGRLLGYRGSDTDITARKKAEVEKADLESRLRQSQKMETLGQLAGGISHDFNNLLSVISGYSQILLMNPELSDSTKHQIEEINQASERAAGLTRQLLLFSRREPLESKIINIDTVISGIEKMLWRLIKADIIVTRNIGPDLWRIKADPGSIEQVIMNLVINASDAMPDGGTLIVETENVQIDETNHINNHPDIKSGRYVKFSVSDTGCGMEDNVRERIFEPFFTTKEAGKGTGLGLATVYGIVKQSNAYIDVQSEVGKGTRFRIYFPQVVNEDAVDGEHRELASTPRGNETILLVEDEESMRMMLQNFLQSIGYAVLPACNGREALEIIAKNKGQIHLLITDIVMPGMKGFEMAKQAKDLFPEIKLLFMSGYAKPTGTHKMMKISGNFIQKPISPYALSVKLREILDKKGKRV